MLNLLVLRSPQPKILATFYQDLLDLPFEYHRHGGPWHYSAVLQSLVFEIYPLLKDQDKPDISTRIGFIVQPLDELIQRLETSGIKVHQQPKQQEWGYTAVIADPDGRKIELTQNNDI